MKIAKCKLKSISPYGQSKKITIEKLPREGHADYEKRAWRDRCHVDSDTGNIFIPPGAFANSLKEAAKYMSIQIPGKGKATFTKNFEAGVMVTEPLLLPIKQEDVQGTWLYVPSDGRRGGTTRVDKCFPTIPSWSGEVNYYILDEIITKDIFEQVLVASGSLIGIGFFRPRNAGYWGRFKIESLKWEDANV